MSPKFASDFEAGNGEDFREVARGVWAFRLRPDTNSSDRQWFYFRVDGAAGEDLTFQLEETDYCNIPHHWEHSRPVYSSDGGATWEHVAATTRHAGNVFTFQHRCASDRELIAFHYPYTWTMANEKLAQWAEHPHAFRGTIGRSVEGRTIDVLRIADPDGRASATRPAAWAVCRQHAGETSANFTLDGMVDFLLSDEPEAVALRRNATVNVVPMINPDGVVAGNYRNNAHGVNLNRVWDAPHTGSSPEVMAVIEAVRAWVRSGHRHDWFGDFHGDSEGWGHYCFHAAEGFEPDGYHRPGRYYADSRRFIETVARLAPDFDPGFGASDHDEPNLARTQQMRDHRAMSLIFEAGYGKVLWGNHQGHLLTVESHRTVGRAIGIALAEYLLDES